MNKGIILAGGLGTRLRPMTKVTNKHLLPVFDKPMIYYPIETMKATGIKEIMIITGPESAGDFMKLLGSGSELGIDLTYKIQDQPTGIAGALKLAKDFIIKETSFMVLLGDNIFEKPLPWKAAPMCGACVYIKKVKDPERFGVVTIDRKDRRIKEIIEKPKKPKSNYIAVGAYVYTPDVFRVIDTIRPSNRGELEITDVNNYYAQRDRLVYAKVKGGWSDAGRVESLLRASIMMAEKDES